MNKLDQKKVHGPCCGQDHPCWCCRSRGIFIVNAQWISSSCCSVPDLLVSDLFVVLRTDWDELVGMTLGHCERPTRDGSAVRNTSRSVDGSRDTLSHWLLFQEKAYSLLIGNSLFTEVADYLLIYKCWWVEFLPLGWRKFQANSCWPNPSGHPSENRKGGSGRCIRPLTWPLSHPWPLCCHAARNLVFAPGNHWSTAGCGAQFSLQLCGSVVAILVTRDWRWEMLRDVEIGNCNQTGGKTLEIGM